MQPQITKVQINATDKNPESILTAKFIEYTLNSSGAESVLPQNLPLDWLEQLLVEARQFWKDNEMPFDRLLHAVTIILLHLNNYDKTIKVNLELLTDYVRFYAMRIALEHLRRTDGKFTFELPTLEKIIDANFELEVVDDVGRSQQDIMKLLRDHLNR